MEIFGKVKRKQTKMRKKNSKELPVIPLRNSVLFPNTIIPLSVGRPASLKALKIAIEEYNNYLFIVCQRDPKIENPERQDLYDFGAIAKVLKVQDLPGGSKNIIVQGSKRAELIGLTERDDALFAEITELEEEVNLDDPEVKAYVMSLKQLATKVAELSPNIPREAIGFIQELSSPSALADIIASNLDVSTEEKVLILEELDIKKRLQRVIWLLTRQLEVLELSQKIQSDVKSEMDRGQREYILRKQLEAIQKELGEISEEFNEIEDLKKKIQSAGMPEEVLKVAEKELNRLAKIPQMSAEYTVVRTYLDWLIEMPWNKETEDNLDLANAEKILDEDHYDLEKVKKRILEYLAVKKLKKDMKGPILCLIGPPGVGKTSLGKSIARALGRKFVRVSLGGTRDEAEIRGHRRTYVGALPGRIIQGIRRAGTKNPLFMIDELDKLGRDAFHGDPASALLEALDPEQNSQFSDHYLEVPFDLSKVFFIGTANIPDTIPAPLLDRMEIIEIPGYTEEDKIKIAEQHLVKEQLEEHGLTPEQAQFTREAIESIIQLYTREAGVRNLKRSIGAVIRGVAKDIAMGTLEKVIITPEEVRKYLGVPRYSPEAAERTNVPGVATGLAWTPTGGDIIFIEATKMKGDGKLILTGHLGDVMKESAQAALSYLRSKATDFQIDEDIFKKVDIHVHVPAGSIPKDGPSAGITLFTALFSLFTGRKVDPYTAMTGEITLRGAVLPVGGIKEKLIAAKRAGIKKVILAEENQKDLEDVPKEICSQLEIVFIKRVDEVIEHAILQEKATEMPNRAEPQKGPACSQVQT